MKTLQLIQGTPEWHAHRATHFNASDAPAMLGLSPYKSRSQILQEVATGIVPEIDAATQKRFDDGHRFESLARSIAEQIIGEDLYAVVGEEGKLSASFDGLTMDESIAFEHKSLNDELRACIKDGGADLAEHYRVQMEQQCAVSGCEKVLFMASKFDADDKLIEERHCWYKPDPKLRQKIIAGWKQFEQDLANYSAPTPEVVVTAAHTESLPVVSVQMQGSIAVISNLDLFSDKLRAYVSNLDMNPSSDQAFADCDQATKDLKRAEDALTTAEESALAQTASIEEMRRTVGNLRDLARTTRLQLEKVVKARKEQIKVEIVQEGQKALAAHIAALNTRLGKPYMPTIAADFAGAIKGKKTVSSLRDAVSVTLANAKIEASATADKIEANLKSLRELAAQYPFLFADTQQIVMKESDDLVALIKNRINEHKAAEQKRFDAERERIREEERERAEREQARKAEEARRDEMALKRAEEINNPSRHENPVREPAEAHTSAPMADVAPAPIAKVTAIGTRKVTRPTDGQILRLIADSYAVSESTVITWLMQMNFEGRTGESA